MKYTVSIPTERELGYPFTTRLIDAGIEHFDYLYHDAGCAVWRIDCKPEQMTLLMLKLNARIKFSWDRE